jgi:methyl-accepting chemotaxis protein
MSKNLRGKFSEWIFGSIRNQIVSLIVILSFFLSLLLATVFYTRAKAISLNQMKESYQSLAIMVGSSAAYDIQFNKKAIPDLAKRIAEADPNILWVEFVDGSSTQIAGEGVLRKSIVDQGLGDINACMSACHGSSQPSATGQEAGVRLSNAELVSTAQGKALMVIGVIQGKTESPGENPEFGFDAAASTPAKNNHLGEVRIIVGLNALKNLQRSYLILGFILLLLSTFIGGIFAYAFSNYLIRSFSAPIQLAQRISQGDLTELKTTFVAKGELGDLMIAFKAMSQQLATTIRRIRDAFEKVEVDTKGVKLHLEKTMTNTQAQAQATEVVAEHTSTIENSIKEVSGHMESLSQLAEEVSASVLQMIASIDQIASSADGLTEAVGTSASTLAENTAALKQIDASAEKINRFVEETSSAMTEMESSIRQIEQNSSSTRQSVEVASQEAVSGVEVVEHTAATISQLQGSFMTVSEAMKNLGKRSEEIGNILGVIDEVMEQTHLLALNAAIIAAQAGEQGKAFSVVAGEIRSLAEKTSLSTREIASLIDSVQQEVNKAVELVTSQNTLVEETVKASEATANSFRRIQKSVYPAVMMTQEINKALQEQGKGAASVVRSVEQLRDLAHQMSRATKEQSSGSDQILAAVNKIRNLSEEVKRATKEQSVGSSLIRKAMDKLTSSVSSVLSLTQGQKKAAEGVESSLNAFRKIAKENQDFIKESSEMVGFLSERAEEAGREVSHFKVQGQ